MGMLANAANDLEEGRHGNAPANTNDGAPDVKGDTHTDYSIRGAIKNHRASTISGDNPLEDIEESDMFERYTSFTGRAITEHDDGTQHEHPHPKSKKKDDITEVEFNPDGSIKRGSTTTPTPSPAAMQQAQQAVKTPKKTPAQQVGYGTGQVDPRLAQAAAGAKPAPAQPEQTAKAALENEMQQLASDLGSDNIRVNAISAGPLDTLSSRVISKYRDMKRVHAERSPMKRNITHEEVAKTALYLCSDLSTGVTGEIIHVDTGYNIMGI